MVGRRGEAPLVPPYKFRRLNKALAKMIRLRYFFFSAFVSPIRTRRWALSFLSRETG